MWSLDQSASRNPQALSHVWLFATLWTVVHQAPLSMGFSRQEYWSGSPCPPPRDLLNPGIEPMSPASSGILYHWASREAHIHCTVVQLLSSVQLFAHQGLHHATLPCLSPSSGVCSNSCPLSPNAIHLILCLPLLLLLSVFPSIRVFFNESVFCNRWPKYWSFSFSISPSNEFSCLISFTIAWFYLLAVQRTLKSLLQHHSSKASILHRSAFFMVQLSHLYMPTAKTIALTRWTIVGKLMSLLFNMFSRCVIAFPPRSKHLLISSMQSLSAETFGAQEKKICHCFPCFPI